MSDSSTPSLGARLREKRQAMGLALADVSEVTKISIRHLEALEREAFQDLPTGSYRWFFLRTYARYLGFDPDEIKKRYDELVHPKPAVPEEKASPPPPVKEPRKIPTFKMPSLPHPTGSSPSAWPAKTRTMMWGGVIVAAAGVAWWIHWLPIRDQEVYRPAAETPATVAPTLNAASLPTPPAKTAPKEADLHVKAKSPTWFEVTVDGQERFSLSMRPGEERIWRARQSFRVWIGSPGGLELFLNEKPLTLESAQGAPLRDVEIFPDGRVEYHSSPLDGP